MSGIMKNSEYFAHMPNDCCFIYSVGLIDMADLLVICDVSIYFLSYFIKDWVSLIETKTFRLSVTNHILFRSGRLCLDGSVNQ